MKFETKCFAFPSYWIEYRGKRLDLEVREGVVLSRLMSGRWTHGVELSNALYRDNNLMLSIVDYSHDMAKDTVDRLNVLLEGWAMSIEIGPRGYRVVERRTKHHA